MIKTLKSGLINLLLISTFNPSFAQENNTIPKNIETIIKHVRINPTIKYEKEGNIIFEKYLLEKENLRVIIYQDKGLQTYDDIINNFDSLKIYKIKAKEFYKANEKKDFVLYSKIKKELLDDIKTEITSCFYTKNLNEKPTNCQSDKSFFDIKFNKEFDYQINKNISLIEFGGYISVLESIPYYARNK